MKKFAAFALVLVLLVVAIVPALAAGNRASPAGNGNGGNTGRRGGAVFSLAGTITAVDSATGLVEVAVVCGNNLVTPYIGQTLSVQTTATTRFLVQNPDGTAVIITLADLEVGQNVSANGQFANGVWTASRVTVGAALTCTP